VMLTTLHKKQTGKHQTIETGSSTNRLTVHRNSPAISSLAAAAASSMLDQTKLS